MLPCPSYGNNNRPSLCHWKWRQLCFLPACLIYGQLAILDHWHHQHHQHKRYHQDHCCHHQNNQCNWCLLNPSSLKLWTWVALVMRSNCNFPLFSIFKLNSGKSGRNSLLSWHAVHPDSELGNCIKVGIAWLSSYGQFVAGVIYGHDMSMQMMACGKWPTIIASVVVFVIKYNLLLQNNTSRAALETCSLEAQFMHFLWKYIILLQYKIL